MPNPPLVLIFFNLDSLGRPIVHPGSDLSRGAPLGNIVPAPILIYVDDLRENLSACDEGSHIKNVYVGPPMYADD